MDEFFPNTQEYCGEEFVVPREAVATEAFTLIAEIEGNLGRPSDNVPLALRNSRGELVADSSVYTGALGLVHMHWTLSERLRRSTFFDSTASESHARRAIELLEQCGERSALDRSLKGEPSLRQGCGYYIGDAGLHVLGCRVHSTPWGSKKLLDRHADALRRIAQAVADGAPDDVYEVLYGQAGMLYNIRAALAVGVNMAPLGKIIAAKLCSAGIAYARQMPHGEWPMMWRFGRKEYLGAAHGVAGIAYMLLDWVLELSAEHRAAVMALAAHLAALCMQHSSLPADTGLKFERTTNHWCHGLPGVVPLFAKAYTVLGIASYLEAARHCSQVIWKEGMLRKGIGLCHGIHGNAYAFLTMYRLTGEEKFMFYAYSFYRTASSSSEYGQSVRQYRDPQRQVQNVPDNPFSLMEGKAGVVCFLIDLLHPRFAEFPGYESPAIADGLSSTEPRAVIPLTVQPPTELVGGNVWELPIFGAADCETIARLAESTVAPEELITRGIKLSAAKFHSLISLCTNATQLVLDQFKDFASDPSTQPPPTLAKRLGALLFKQQAVKPSSRAAVAPLIDLSKHVGVPRLTVVAAYVVRYDSVHHPRIHSHRDACDVTFNLCLRKTCADSELYFDEVDTRYTHVPGRAVVHWGKLLHHTKRLQGFGERLQLVILYNLKGIVASQPHRVDASELYDAVLGNIFSFLSFPDLARCMYTCRRMLSIIDDDDFWQLRYREICEKHMQVPKCEELLNRAASAICAKCLSPTDRLGLIQCSVCRSFTHRQLNFACRNEKLEISDVVMYKSAFRCHDCGSREPCPFMEQVMPVSIAQGGWKNCVMLATTSYTAFSHATGLVPTDLESWANTSTMLTGSSYGSRQRMMTGVYMPEGEMMTTGIYLPDDE